MTLSPDVLVLPAFTAAEYTGDASEVAPWLDYYEFDRTLDVAGLQYPLRLDSETNLALAPTGIGKSAAATTVSALATAGDLSETTILSVGIAGCRPAAGTLGSVFLADYVVDWDIKLRIGETTGPMQWLVDDYVWELDDAHVSRALQVARVFLSPTASRPPKSERSTTTTARRPFRSGRQCVAMRSTTAPKLPGRSKHCVTPTALRVSRRQKWKTPALPPRSSDLGSWTNI